MKTRWVFLAVLVVAVFLAGTAGGATTTQATGGEITSIYPDYGTENTPVVISGYGFGESQRGGFVSFSSSQCSDGGNQTVVSWSDTEIKIVATKLTIGCSYGVYVVVQKPDGSLEWIYYTRGNFRYGNNSPLPTVTLTPTSVATSTPTPIPTATNTPTPVACNPTNGWVVTSTLDSSGGDSPKLATSAGGESHLWGSWVNWGNPQSGPYTLTLGVTDYGGAWHTAAVTSSEFILANYQTRAYGKSVFVQAVIFDKDLQYVFKTLRAALDEDGLWTINWLPTGVSRRYNSGPFGFMVDINARAHWLYQPEGTSNLVYRWANFNQPAPTWSTPVTIPTTATSLDMWAREQQVVFVANRYEYEDEGYRSYFFSSIDGGQTWSSQRLFGNNFSLYPIIAGINKTATGINKASPQQDYTSDHFLVAAILYGTGPDVLATTMSENSGLTWSQPVTLTQSNFSRYAAVVSGDGHAMVVWDNFSVPNGDIVGVSSTDYGQTWRGPLLISGECGIPTREETPAVAFWGEKAYVAFKSDRNRPVAGWEILLAEKSLPTLTAGHRLYLPLIFKGR